MILYANVAMVVPPIIMNIHELILRSAVRINSRTFAAAFQRPADTALKRWGSSGRKRGRMYPQYLLL